MDVEQLLELQELGLTKPEIKVYSTLLELDESKTGVLCSITKISSSRIYSILDSLIKKGLVSYKISNKIKIFMPSSPEILETILKEKEKKILLIVKKLKEKQTKTSEFQYKTFNNIRGIKSMFYEINSVMNKNMVIDHYTSAKGSFERLIDLFSEHHALKFKRKIKSRLLLSREYKDLGKKRKNEFTEVRYNNLKNLAEWGLIGDKMLYISYIKGDEPKGILIEDSVIVKTFRDVFDKIWEKSKLN